MKTIVFWSGLTQVDWVGQFRESSVRIEKGVAQPWRGWSWF